MLRTVFSGFYNEEYLLPWWLRHHREIFDYGILIDNGSTDQSVAVCRDLVPHWRIVRGRYHQVTVIPSDFEVMEYESQLPGWKIFLNVTEFLLAPHLDLLEKEIVEGRYPGSMLDPYIMVDMHPDQLPDHSLPLFAQKPYGYRQLESPNSPLISLTRSRFYHRMQVGAYTPGKHTSLWPRLAASPESRQWAMILWFFLSPWNEQFIARKLQIGATLSKSDRDVGFGWQHFLDFNSLDSERQRCLPFIKDLTNLLRLNAPHPRLCRSALIFPSET